MIIVFVQLIVSTFTEFTRFMFRFWAFPPVFIQSSIMMEDCKFGTNCS